LAGTAVHEQEHGPLGPRRKMRLLRRQKVLAVGCCGLLFRAGMFCKKAVARQKVDQCQTGKTAPHLPQKFAPRAPAGSMVRNESRQDRLHLDSTPSENARFYPSSIDTNTSAEMGASRQEIELLPP